MVLVCTVRYCRMPLVRREGQYVCANHHSFDVARSGYVNLLQPQDRRSKNPGDNADAVEARRRFYERGDPLVDAIVRAFPVEGALLDVGCGEGSHLAAFRRAYDVEAWGVDISVPAIELAARTHRDCEWVVANADRFLPFADASFDAVLSITARMNADEFRRVLRPNGALLVVIPGAEDLVELREAVQGERVERDRVERTIAAFASHFALERRETLRHVARLDRAAMIEVMSSSYRGLRTRERARLEQLDETDVTLARDLLLFRPGEIHERSR
ncbi:MAG TPA: methyltransferase domain-containing protein [Thermoanaerobaculia bacterium]|jgi:23S rRNA (guanine745-N1)-methyltransferase|nr:methyltransferase domain-containing protein [Thermoanaerobaculia bacterium]